MGQNYRFRCPVCDRRLRAKSQLADRMAKCLCGHTVRVPQVSSTCDGLRLGGAVPAFSLGFISLGLTLFLGTIAAGIACWVELRHSGGENSATSAANTKGVRAEIRDDVGEVVHTHSEEVKLEEMSREKMKRIKKALRHLLDEDARLNRAMELAKAKNAEEQAIMDYCSKCNAIDISECPAEVQVAYRRHVGAWRKMAQFWGKIDAILPGFRLLSANSEWGQERGELLKEIERTWKDVEDRAAFHGVVP